MSETTETAVTPAEAQELEATGHYVPAEMHGEDRSEKLEIVPPGAWKQSWQRKLKLGEMDEFMRHVLSPASYELYVDLDPTNDAVGDFLNAASEASGEPLGKSSGPKGSSKATRKR